MKNQLTESPGNKPFEIIIIPTDERHEKKYVHNEKKIRKLERAYREKCHDRSTFSNK